MLIVIVSAVLSGVDILLLSCDSCELSSLLVLAADDCFCFLLFFLFLFDPLASSVLTAAFLFLFLVLLLPSNVLKCSSSF